MTKFNIPIMVYHTILYGIFTVLLILSRTHLPGDYRMGENTISTLGDKITNPYGWWYFSIALIVMGIGMSLSVTHMYQYFEVSAGMYISFILETLGCIGLILIAIFDQNKKIHVIVAYLTFIFFVIGIILMGIIYFLNGKIHIETIISISLVTIIFFIGGIFMLLHKLSVEHFEWILVITLLLFVIFISGIICNQ